MFFLKELYCFSNASFQIYLNTSFFSLSEGISVRVSIVHYWDSNAALYSNLWISDLERGVSSHAEDKSNVADIGVCWSSDEKVIKGMEQMVGWVGL